MLEQIIPWGRNNKTAISLFLRCFKKPFFLRLQKFVIVNPFPNKLRLLCVCNTSHFKNIVGRGEIAHNEQFLLFPQCFPTFWITFSHVYSVWKSLKFVAWERVNNYISRSQTKDSSKHEIYHQNARADHTMGKGTIKQPLPLSQDVFKNNFLIVK